MLKMLTSKRLWRDSASLLIAGRNPEPENDKTNYKILVMKRPSKSSFMPHATVFPGGVFQKNDEDPRWMDYFQSCGIAKERFQILSNVAGLRPSIFQYSTDQTVARDISLRICAIRETFEEVGLLICRKPNECQNADLFSSNISNFDIKNWQKKVHSDPNTFLELCKSLKVVPDVWRLYEWSTWLTPIVFPKRFQTVFYFVALNDQPSILNEQIEVTESSWQSIENLINLHKNEKITLNRPQFYELMRLYNVNDIDELVKFTKERSRKGVELIYPIVYRTADADVSILPGDDFYPKEPDYEFEPADVKSYLNEKCEDFQNRVKNLHRTEDRGHIIQVISNIKSAKGHLPLHRLIYN